jgi:hypothetical protein
MEENEFSKLALEGFSILNHKIGKHLAGIEDEEFRALYEDEMKNNLMPLSGIIGNYYLILNMFSYQASPIIKKESDRLIKGLEKLWAETSGRGYLPLKDIPNLAKEVMSDYKEVYEFYKNSD